MIAEGLTQLPSWAGNVPQWGMLAVLIVTAWKLMKGADSNVIKEQGRRVTELKKDYDDLRRSCDKETRELRSEIAALHAEINGLRAQRVSEQIATMRAILQSVDSPELKKQLAMLEAVQRSTNPMPTAVEAEKGPM